jgi:hypothetical protein
VVAVGEVVVALAVGEVVVALAVETLLVALAAVALAVAVHHLLQPLLQPDSEPFLRPTRALPHMPRVPQERKL